MSTLTDGTPLGNMGRPIGSGAAVGRVKVSVEKLLRLKLRNGGIVIVQSKKVIREMVNRNSKYQLFDYFLFHSNVIRFP